MEDFPDRVSLDDVPHRVLLFLSKNPKTTIHTISKMFNISLDTAFQSITILEKQIYIRRENNGEFNLTQKGSDFLKNNSATYEKVSQPSHSKEDMTAKNIDLIKYLTDLLVLLAIPIWLIPPLGILAIGLMAFITINDYRLVLLLCLILVVILGIYSKWSFQTVETSTTLVLFRLGVCIGEKGPGLVLVIPFLDEAKLVDLKVNHIELKDEACITQDNVQIKVDFVYWWKIQDAEKSVTQVNRASESIEKLATGGLRAVIASFDFNDLQEQRQNLNEKVQKEIGELSTDWGIVVTNVEIQEVKTSNDIRTAMEEWRTAKWRSEATKKLAEGEAEALKLLRQAAYNLDSNTLNLEYFKTLKKLGEGQATKYFFPIELTNLVQSLARESKDRNNTTNNMNELPKTADKSNEENE